MSCVSIVRVSGYGIDIPAPVPPIAELRSTIMQFRRGTREIASLARAAPFHVQKGLSLAHLVLYFNYADNGRQTGFPFYRESRLNALERGNDFYRCQTFRENEREREY